jgi:hypothetical protein
MTIEDHSSVVGGEQNGIDHRIDEQLPTTLSQKSNHPIIAAKVESHSTPFAKTNGENDKSTINNDGEDVVMQSREGTPVLVNGQRENNAESSQGDDSSNVRVKCEQQNSLHNDTSIQLPIPPTNGISNSDKNEQKPFSSNDSIMHPLSGPNDQTNSTEELNSASDPISYSSHQSPSIQTPQKRSNRSTSSQLADSNITSNNIASGGGGSANLSPNKQSSSVPNGTSPKRFKRPKPILSRNFAPLPQETPAPSQLEGNSNGSKRLERKSKVSII